MTVHIGKGARIAPRLFGGFGDNLASRSLCVLHQFINARFPAGCDADEAFTMAALCDFAVPDDPPKASYGNKHESVPVIEMELQWPRHAVARQARPQGVNRVLCCRKRRPCGDRRSAS